MATPTTSQTQTTNSFTDATKPIIIAHELGKTYRSGKLEVPALRKVSFSVTPGEFVAIVGPSGSGKSTLFYLLGGLTTPTSGSLHIGGADFSGLSDIERTRMRRAKIGFIFQRFNLLPTLTAMGNIEIAHDIDATPATADCEAARAFRAREGQLRHGGGASAELRGQNGGQHGPVWRHPFLPPVGDLVAGNRSLPARATYRNRCHAQDPPR